MMKNGVEQAPVERRRVVYLPKAAILEEIVQTPIEFGGNNEEALLCQRMVEELTEEEQEQAARTSYAYWAWEQIAATGDKACVRLKMATKEACRHYRAQNGDYKSALEHLKATIHWRKEGRVDLIKACLSQDNVRHGESLTTHTIDLSEDDAVLCDRFETLIRDGLNVQIMAVRGFDRQECAVVVRRGRYVKWKRDEAERYRLVQIYIAERAIAVTEIRNRGGIDKLTTILDYKGYEIAHAPPTSVIADLLVMLQAHYPERLGKALILDAPLWMQAVLKVVTTFLSEKTRGKLEIVGATALSMSSLWSNSQQEDLRDSSVRNIIDPKYAMPFMLKDAELTSTIDVERQLKQIPFFETYDFGIDAIDPGR